MPPIKEERLLIESPLKVYSCTDNMPTPLSISVANSTFERSFFAKSPIATPESLAVLFVPAEISTRSAAPAFADIVTMFAVPLDTFVSA